MEPHDIESYNGYSKVVCKSGAPLSLPPGTRRVTLVSYQPCHFISLAALSDLEGLCLSDINPTGLNWAEFLANIHHLPASIKFFALLEVHDIQGEDAGENVLQYREHGIIQALGQQLTNLRAFAIDGLYPNYMEELDAEDYDRATRELTYWVRLINYVFSRLESLVVYNIDPPFVVEGLPYPLHRRLCHTDTLDITDFDDWLCVKPWCIERDPECDWSDKYPIVIQI